MRIKNRELYCLCSFWQEGSFLLAGALSLIAGARTLLAGASSLNAGRRFLFAGAPILFAGARILFAGASSLSAVAIFLLVVTLNLSAVAIFLFEVWKLFVGTDYKSALSGNYRVIVNTITLLEQI